MRIKVLWVGKTKERYLAEGIKFYEGRIAPYALLQIAEVRGERILPKVDEQGVRAKEGERILSKVQANETMIVLDATGRMFTSEEFSSFLMDFEARGLNRIVFVLGGPLGLSREVLVRAHSVVSFSRMTFTHEMARLILMEQIYRAMTIARGESYHK